MDKKVCIGCLEFIDSEEYVDSNKCNYYHKTCFDECNKKKITTYTYKNVKHFEDMNKKILKENPPSNWSTDNSLEKLVELENAYEKHNKIFEAYKDVVEKYKPSSLDLKKSVNENFVEHLNKIDQDNLKYSNVPPEIKLFFSLLGFFANSPK